MSVLLPLIKCTNSRSPSLSGAEHGVLAGQGGEQLCLLQWPYSQPQGIWRAARSDEGGKWEGWKEWERQTDVWVRCGGVEFVSFLSLLGQRRDTWERKNTLLFLWQESSSHFRGREREENRIWVKIDCCLPLHCLFFGPISLNPFKFIACVYISYNT